MKLWSIRFVMCQVNMEYNFSMRKRFLYRLVGRISGIWNNVAKATLFPSPSQSQWLGQKLRGWKMPVKKLVTFDSCACAYLVCEIVITRLGTYCSTNMILSISQYMNIEINLPGNVSDRNPQFLTRVDFGWVEHGHVKCKKDHLYCALGHSPYFLESRDF